jgi:hypothetical protein
MDLRNTAEHFSGHKQTGLAKAVTFLAPIDLLARSSAHQSIMVTDTASGQSVKHLRYCRRGVENRDMGKGVGKKEIGRMISCH